MTKLPGKAKPFRTEGATGAKHPHRPSLFPLPFAKKSRVTRISRNPGHLLASPAGSAGHRQKIQSFTYG